jgi:hypothetical protein
MVHLAVPTSVYFHFAPGFSTQTLAQLLDSLVRVSRRVTYIHYASILAEARSSVMAGGMACMAITLPKEPHSLHLFPTALTDAGLPSTECTIKNDG